MHFSVTCNTKQNNYDNTGLIFGIPLIKIIAFCLFKKKMQNVYEFSY